MIVFKNIQEIQEYLKKLKKSKKLLGFVPTMGALHSGHISLIEQSKKENEVTICSIFVNPTQFNSEEDLKKYPRTIEKDIKKLIEAECDVLFYPDYNEMYPKEEINSAEDYGHITSRLEGKFRPGHFNGVINIVTKLFATINPDTAYFGQKDFQQCAVIKELIKRNGFNIKLNCCPTLREEDGLAMSSRNMRLSNEERKQAVQIFKALQWIKLNFKAKTVAALKMEARKIIEEMPLLKTEYIEICDAETFEIMPRKIEGRRLVALAAVYCGNVRLIDNLVLG